MKWDWRWISGGDGKAGFMDMELECLLLDTKEKLDEQCTVGRDRHQP